jgi:Rps23 Pro-64 3,4-dihydroxylase Tpa1-like proline 4-hydroxylase
MSDFIGLFNRGLFDDEAVRERLRAQLARGRAIVIPNAIRADIAEQAHAELDASTRWKPYEGASPFFHYRHHNLYSDDELPPSAVALKRAFASPSAKQLMSALSERDCEGPLDFGASLYLPGDHSLPHQDLGLGRSVAFIWHMTKEWDPRWGGGLFWCPSGITLLPQFNCLMLFNVTPASTHFVTVVSPYARAKRLSLNGWWTRTSADEAPIGKEPEPLAERAFDAGGYGPPLEYVEGGAKIMAM